MPTRREHRSCADKRTSITLSEITFQRYATSYKTQRKASVMERELKMGGADVEDRWNEMSQGCTASVISRNNWKHNPTNEISRSRACDYDRYHLLGCNAL